jgi:diguanylate cyclase (GGDEF)-like protein
MFLDLDNFKPLNDTHGHAVGDLLLIEVAKRLKDCIREMDTVARLGGDEFVVVLTELSTDRTTSIQQTLAVAEKIRLRIAAPYLLNFVQGDGSKKTVEHRCTTSVGVIMFLEHRMSLSELMKCADSAMYKAKDNGRNQTYMHPLSNTLDGSST